MNSDKPSFQKPGQQNWQQKQPQQQPKPQGGHQPKRTHGAPSDRTAGESNFGKK